MATDFGNRLRAARKYAGLTQLQAEEKTGIRQSTISTAEREGFSSTETVIYARAYGVDAHWLATGEGDMVAGDIPAGAFPVREGKIKAVSVVGKSAGGYMAERIWGDGDYPVGATGEVADVATSDPHAFVVPVEGPSLWASSAPSSRARPGSG